MELTIAASELEILIDFLDEALDHLEGIEEKILQLENSQDMELVNSIFRPAHTIKGTASFLGLNDIKTLAHEMETLLDDLRNDRIDVSAGLIDTLLDGVDCLAGMLKAVQEGIKNRAEPENSANDPILINIAEIEFNGVVEAINELKKEPKAEKSDAAGSGESFQQKSLDDGKKPELLTSEELKEITYPMEMDISFVQESREHLDSLEQALLDLENNAENFELYNDIFRDLHSLKGGAGVLVSTIESQEKRVRHPITVFQELAHAAEGMVQRARDSKTVLSADAIETLLNIVDRIKDILDGFVNHDSSCAMADDLIALCKKYSGDGSFAAGVADKKSAAVKEGESNRAQTFAVANTLSQCLSAVKAGLDEIKNDDKRNSALGKIIRSVNTIIKVNTKSGFSDIKKSSESILNTAIFLRQGKDENEEDLITAMVDNFKTLQKIIHDRIQIHAGSGDAAQIPASPTAVSGKPAAEKIKKAPAPGKTAAPSVSSFIKVPQERLDILMNFVGELIISKNNFSALAREITMDNNLPQLGKKVKSAGDYVGRITDELQNIVMKMRMLPIGTVFAKFKRLVRDLAKKLDKKIVLKLSGEETELDKTIIETLGDPLVHLIRNCADHAIEKVEERKANGKPPEGTIHLKAYNQGQNVIIEITDDGRGIDPDNIRVKAVEKGYMSLEELENLDDRAVQNLIFKPGFSGAKEVTEVSGRGVGMDVVKTNVEKIGGVVTLRSKKGIGTTFTITLPLTLAISRGLKVKAGGQYYYLPLDYIVETVKISPNLICSHKKMQMAVIRGNLLPIYSLAALLGDSSDVHMRDNSEKKPLMQGQIPYLPDVNGNNSHKQINITNKNTNKNENENELSMVILNINGNRAALAVDCFYTENEYVIKPLSGALSKIPEFTGATITGSGEVILILDPLKLF